MGVTSKTANIKDIITHFSFTHIYNADTFYSISGVFWYLGIQMQLYLLFPFIAKLFEYLQSNCKKMIYLIMGISFIPSILVIGVNNVTIQKSFIVLLPCFLLGILLYNNYFKIKNKIVFIMLLLTVFIISTFIYMPNIPNHILKIILGILVGYIIINFNDIIEKIFIYIKNPIETIAISSYSIYLYNYIIYAFKLNTDKNSLLEFILYFLLAFGFGIIMHELIEKSSSECLNKLLKRKEK